MKKLIKITALILIITSCKSTKIQKKIIKGKLVFLYQKDYDEKELIERTRQNEVYLYNFALNTMDKDSSFLKISKKKYNLSYAETKKKLIRMRDSVLKADIKPKYNKFERKDIIYFKKNIVKIFHTVDYYWKKEEFINLGFQEINLNKKISVTKRRSDTITVIEPQEFPRFFKNHSRNFKYIIDKKDKKKILGFNCYKVTITSDIINSLGKPADKITIMYVTEKIALQKNVVLEKFQFNEIFFPLEISSYSSEFPNIIDKKTLIEFNNEVNDKEEIDYKPAN